MFEKIKRLSSEYRKHEKEILEMKIKQMNEIVNSVILLSNNIIQMQLISSQPKSSLAAGGVALPENLKKGPANEIVTVSKEISDKIRATRIENFGRCKRGIKINIEDITKKVDNV